MLLLLLLSCFSRVQLSENPWTAAYQAPLSMGFSRQEYWSGLPLPSPILLFAILRTIALQASLSMEFSRQEYWSGFPCPAPGDIPDPGIETKSPALQADSLPTKPTGKPIYIVYLYLI